LSFSLKESRAPDPEHLKAVWSQAPDEGRQPVVNSLEGIADDLTALPFTLQDVKSEDGETPPPTSTAPSRMSLHDVTRAFQQVPSPSSTSSALRSTSPSNMSLPSQRNYAYSLPTPPNNVRPAYGPYSSSAMGHSTSPTLVYSHAISPSPVPGRMPINGHAPLYSQPLWMPPTAPSQSHGGMFRPLPSPYPSQLMSYPAPSSNPPMYAAASSNMQNPLPPPQQNDTSQTRGRNMPVMSPVMQHSHPNTQVYPGSPVLMHAVPVMQVTHGAYIPRPPSRGQMRTDHVPPLQQGQSGHHPSSSGYTTVPPTSFVRTTW
jgi:serine/arginine repetitive matrix protein 2